MIDIDASWDGTGSLDDHRMKVMETLEQPGFGSGAKQIPEPQPVNVEVDEEPEADDDGE